MMQQNIENFEFVSSNFATEPMLQCDQLFQHKKISSTKFNVYGNFGLARCLKNEVLDRS